MKKMTIEIKVLDRIDFKEFLNEVADDLKVAEFIGDDDKEKSYILKTPGKFERYSLDKDQINEDIKNNGVVSAIRKLEGMKQESVNDDKINISPLIDSLIKKIKKGGEITEEDCMFEYRTATVKIDYEDGLPDEVLTVPDDEDEFYDEDE
jgi:hypothetical protein